MRNIAKKFFFFRERAESAYFLSTSSDRDRTINDFSY